MFNKEDGHFVLIIKYVTSSVKVDILDIEELTFKDMDENQIVVKFKLEKNLKDEKFRTTEGKFIIKTFKEFQTKAYQNLDINKAKKEEKKKAKKIEADVQNIISIFG